MRKVYFIQADVFSDSPFGGNPVVVVPDPGPMTSDEMQSLSRGMSFAETAFVTQPTLDGADLAVRCFTATTELAYSGHQLLGAAYVMATEGRIELTGELTELQVQVGKQLLPVTVGHDAERGITRVSTLECPVGHQGGFENYGQLAAALSIDPMAILQTGLPTEIVETGLRCLIVPLTSLATLRDMLPVTQALDEILQDQGAHCALVWCRDTLSPINDVHVRVFAPPLGVPEDPATGSANGALASYLVRHGVIEARPRASLRCEQGSELGRPSVVEVEIDSESSPPRIWVGGRVQRSVEGSVFY
ncbi:MAG: PhzF family phenazine biosynthesis protein [Caldilineae bacterium]|nr:PhzF family phenazine biosynthesis protein [Chloroflexota bacterium]MCB9176478.1 PhzF family phenazine biosynthesis protein [Caldilineae bacterium]